MGNQPAAVPQSRAQRLWSVTGRSGSSQAWAWTRAARFNLISDKKQRASGTPPRPTSTPHNIIRSSAEGRAGGLDLPELSGEKYVSIFFPHLVPKKTKQTLLYFPHYCSLVWISGLPSVFPSCSHSRGSPASVFHHNPETAAQAARPNTSFRSPHRWVGHGATGTTPNPFRQELTLELWCLFHGFCTKWSVIDAPLS